jgi:hypothetical protein
MEINSKIIQAYKKDEAIKLLPGNLNMVQYVDVSFKSFLILVWKSL